MRVVHSEATLLNAISLTRGRGRGRLQQRHGVHGEVPGEPAPYRVPGARRPARQRHPSGRARLLHAAPPPEGRRGGPGPRHHAGAARARSASAAPRPAGDIGYRGAGTFEFLYENGRVLFHRDEHPGPGRAPGHRDGHRRRHRQGADPDRRRRAPALPPGGHRDARPCHRVPHQCRGLRDLHARAPARSPSSTPPAVPASAWRPTSTAAIRSRPTTTP